MYIEPAGTYARIANQGTQKKPSASVDKLDISGIKVVASVKTGKGAHGVVSSPDGKYIYVINMYDDTVTVVDSQGNIAVATVKVGKTPYGITYTR